jgi:hypothetical protein
VQETAVISHTNDLGAEVTTTAYMKYRGAGDETDLHTVTKVGDQLYANVPQPRYSGSPMGDPVLAMNPFSDGPGRHRTYLAGAEFASGAGGVVNLWHSDDGGKSGWTRRDVAESASFLDRPSIAVSWYAATRGYVYVSALTPGDRIHIYRSTDGGEHFTEPNPNGVSVANTAQSATLSVDSSTGEVYLFWVDWTGSGVIRVARSPQVDANLTPLQSLDFTSMQPLSITDGTLLRPVLQPQYQKYCDPDANSACDNLCSSDKLHCVKADSSIAQRYNALSRTFGIVWHQRNPADGRTDVKFASFNPGNFWSTPVTVNGVTAGDQWHPALDYDGTGDYLVTYYDRRNDSQSNMSYHLYGTRLSANGNRLGGDTRLTENASSVTALRLVPRNPGDNGLPNMNVHTMGEYHDLWFWNDHWTASYIFVPSGATDEVNLTTAMKGALTSAPADFNGDGVSDFVLYRHGTWLAFDRISGSQLWSRTLDTFTDGIPLPMDYDGDGRTDMTVYCPGRAWHFWSSSGAYRGIWIGVAGDIPVPGDYDGDGKDDIVVYRNGTWIAYDYDTASVKWSVTTDTFGDGIPLAMDYNGDGKSDFTVFRPGRAWHFYNAAGAYVKGIWIGYSDVVPVPGDYDGDGTEEVVVFRGGGAQLFYDFNTAQYVRGVWTGAASQNGEPLQPAPLDYDGDGSVDFTIFTGGQWVSFQDDGAYASGIIVGLPGDLAMSRRAHTRATP